MNALNLIKEHNARCKFEYGYDSHPIVHIFLPIGGTKSFKLRSDKRALEIIRKLEAEGWTVLHRDGQSITYHKNLAVQ